MLRFSIGKFSFDCRGFETQFARFQCKLFVEEVVLVLLWQAFCLKLVSQSWGCFHLAEYKHFNPFAKCLSLMLAIFVEGGGGGGGGHVLYRVVLYRNCFVPPL